MPRDLTDGYYQADLVELLDKNSMDQGDMAGVQFVIEAFLSIVFGMLRAIWQIANSIIELCTSHR